MSTGYISRHDAANLLGVGVRTFDYYVRCGYLTTIKRGQRVYASKNEVLGFLESKLRKGKIDSKDPAVGLPVVTAEEVVRDRAKGCSDNLKADMTNYVFNALTKMDMKSDIRWDNIDSRVEFLERSLGVMNRAHGLTLPVLLQLADTVLDRYLRVARMGENEREQWINMIESFDHETTRLCAQKPQLRHLPQWLLRLGNKIADLETAGNKTRVLVACRSLRLLVASIYAPAPFIQFTQLVDEDLSPVDAYIIQAHTIPLEERGPYKGQS